MKLRMLLLLLLMFSSGAFAAHDTSVLGSLQKKMTSQSSSILRNFEKSKMKTTEGIYQDIWLQEFNVIDFIEVGIHSVGLYEKIENKGSLEKFRLETIISHAARLCDSSALMLNEYQDRIKVLEAKIEVAIQAKYAKEACSELNRLIK